MNTIIMWRSVNSLTPKKLNKQDSKYLILKLFPTWSVLSRTFVQRWSPTQVFEISPSERSVALSKSNILGQSDLRGCTFSLESQHTHIKQVLLFLNNLDCYYTTHFSWLLGIYACKHVCVIFS